MDLELSAYSGGSDPQNANEVWLLAAAPESKADDPEWSLPKAAGKFAAEKAMNRDTEARF